MRVVAPIPGLLLYAPGGAIFGGWLGGTLALAGNGVGAFIAALVGRLLGEPWVTARFGAAGLSRLRDRTVRHAVWLIALLRLNPFTSTEPAQPGGTTTVVSTASRMAGPATIAPGSSAYGTARLVYNERFDAVRPLAIVRVQDVKDVQAVVGWARRNEVAIVPRSGGHSYGGWSTGTGVVVDLGRLRGIRVEGRTAVIGAGRRLIDIYGPLAGKGLTIPAGS